MSKPKRKDHPSVVFWGIMLGTHDEHGGRRVPTYRQRKQLERILGCNPSIKEWRKWAQYRVNYSRDGGAA